MKNEEDSHLINECLNGNADSYKYLVDRYYKIIFRLANKFLRNYDEAEEITQIVFVKAYENLSKYNPKHKFFSWLYKIAVNESINYDKRKKYSEKLDDEFSSQTENPEIFHDKSEIKEIVRNSIMQLDMIYRLPILLRHFDNLSYKELSFILGIPEKKVKSRLYTGRQLLRDLLIKNKVL